MLGTVDLGPYRAALLRCFRAVLLGVCFPDAVIAVAGALVLSGGAAALVLAPYVVRAALVVAVLSSVRKPFYIDTATMADIRTTRLLRFARLLSVTSDRYPALRWLGVCAKLGHPAAAALALAFGAPVLFPVAVAAWGWLGYELLRTYGIHHPRDVVIAATRRTPGASSTTPASATPGSRAGG